MPENATSDDPIEESLRRRGLHPGGELLDEVRDLLREQTARERRGQGLGDTELMKLCCVQLFNAGALDDVLLIWHAKTSSMDADCSIDIQLLCGAGLPRTKTFLSGQPHQEQARKALERLLACEASGDFEDFSVQEHGARYAAYYGDGPRP